MSFVNHYLPYFRQWLISHLLSAGYFYRLCLWRAASPPFSGALKAPHPLCCMSFFSSLFIIQFFFSVQESVCSWGCAGLYQGWLWEYHMTLIFSPVGLHLPSRFGVSILFSQCNVAWRCFVWAGGLGVRFLLLLSVFFLPRVAPVSQQHFWFMEFMLFASSL
jgi:hypothetical protein